MKHDTYMGFVIPKPKSACPSNSPGCHYPVENDGDKYCKYCSALKRTNDEIMSMVDGISTDPSLISGHPDEFKDREENADTEF